MIRLKNTVMSAALVLLCAASVLTSSPLAYASQSILSVTAPDAVDAGATFRVTVRTHYEFKGGDVAVMAKVRDPSTTNDVSLGTYSSEVVRGEGDLSWDMEVTAPSRTIEWALEAYVIHWEGTPHREVVDSTRGFTVVVRGAQPQVFDFSLKVEPATVSFKPGESASCGVSVALVNGPAQEVSLMYTIPPITGISGSISAPKGTPPFNSMFKISTTTQTPPGTYTINVAGVAGTLNRVASVTLTVTAVQLPSFDFSVAVSPDTLSLKPGESGSSTVSVRLVSGSAQEVSFMYTVPQVVGVGASISPTKGTPPFTSTLRVTTTSQTPPGTYTINMAGVGGGVEKRATVTLTVTGGPPPGPTSTDWSIGDLWFMPSTLKPGDQVGFQAKISALSSDKPFPQQVSVDVFVDGGGAMGMYSTEASVLVPSVDVAVTVSPGSRWTATAGSHTVTFVADPQGIYNDPNRANNRRELSFSVAATPPPAGFDFSLTVKPASQSLKPEGKVVYDIYVDLEKGTSQTVTLFISGLPSDASYAFDPPFGNPAYQSKLTVYVPMYTASGAPMPAGAYALTVTGEGGGVTHSATTKLTLEAAAVATTRLTSAVATLVTQPVTNTETGEAGQGLGRTLSEGSILLIVLIVVLAALTAYYLSKRRKTSTTEPTASPSTSDEEPPTRS